MNFDYCNNWDKIFFVGNGMTVNTSYPNLYTTDITQTNNLLMSTQFQILIPAQSGCLDAMWKFF